MAHDYDVAVVGSGPAGAACALGLARLGLSVALIDERAFPRNKVCGEYLNCGAVRELHALGLGPALEAHALPLRGMRLNAHGERADFHFTRDAWSVPRRTLDDTVRTAALDAGAQPLQGRFRALARDGGAICISIVAGEDEQQLRARYLVGADGMRSAVARACNLTGESKRERFATGGHYRGVALENWIEMYASPRGYLALNPLDYDTANVMFVVNRAQLMQSRGALSAELARFSSEITAGSRPLDDTMLTEERHTIGPLDHRTIRPVAPRVLLVGDAAAFVDPFSGQGVYLALTGARAAVSTIARAVKRSEDEERAWFAYTKTIRGSIAERQRVTFMMKAMLSLRGASRRAARRLRARPEDFVPLIDAVCGNVAAPSAPRMALTLARALR